MSMAKKKRKAEKVSESEELDCSICYELVEDAVQTPCCGNLYCRACITEALSNRKSCPTCRKTLCVVQLTPDHRAERKSKAMVRPCSQGNCSFTGNHQAMQAHVAEAHVAHVDVKKLLAELKEEKRELEEEAEELREKIEELEEDAEKSFLIDISHALHGPNLTVEGVVKAMVKNRRKAALVYVVRHAGATPMHIAYTRGEANSYSIRVTCAHHNVSVFCTRPRMDIPPDASSTFVFMSPKGASHDRSFRFTGWPASATSFGFANAMSEKEMGEFKFGGNYLVFEMK